MNSFSNSEWSLLSNIGEGWASFCTKLRWSNYFSVDLHVFSIFKAVPKWSSCQYVVAWLIKPLAQFQYLLLCESLVDELWNCSSSKVKRSQLHMGVSSGGLLVSFPFSAVCHVGSCHGPSPLRPPHSRGQACNQHGDLCPVVCPPLRECDKHVHRSLFHLVARIWPVWVTHFTIKPAAEPCSSQPRLYLLDKLHF